MTEELRFSMDAASLAGMARDKLYQGLDLDGAMSLLAAVGIGTDLALAVLDGRVDLEGTCPGKGAAVAREPGDDAPGLARLIKRLARRIEELEEDAGASGGPPDNDQEDDTHDGAPEDGEDYGWLSPSGEFHPVPWGRHQDWAMSWLEAHPVPGETDPIPSWCAGDTLVGMGWILLHSPYRGIAVPEVSPSKEPTKAQRDFLFGYYADRCLDKFAAQWA